MEKLTRSIPIVLKNDLELEANNSETAEEDHVVQTQSTPDLFVDNDDSSSGIYGSSTKPIC